MRRRIQTKGVREQIAASLRKDIRSGRYVPGERLESTRLLARQFGVCIYTMSQALLELASEGLVQGRHGSGTFVTDWQKNRHVGILCELDISHSQVSPFFPRVVQGLRRFLEERGTRVRVYIGDHQLGDAPPAEPPVEFLADLESHQLRGLIIVTSVTETKWLDRLKQERFPVIGCQPISPYCVTSDTEDKIRQAIRRLLKEGRTRLAVMGWGAVKETWEVEKAFRQLMQAMGATVRDKWIRHDLPPTRLGAGWDEFREIWTAYKDKPDGMIICDDMLLRDVAMAILNLQIRVPEQLMIVSHANRGSGVTVPFPVTYMEYDPDAYVQAAGGMLLRLLHGEEVGEKAVCLPFRWVENFAVCAVPGVDKEERA